MDKQPNKIMSFQTFLFQFFERNPLLTWLLIGWVLFWKGLALWRAARNNQQGWFIAILILNTLGVLEILYLFIFSKKSSQNFSPSQEV